MRSFMFCDSLCVSGSLLSMWTTMSFIWSADEFSPDTDLSICTHVSALVSMVQSLLLVLRKQQLHIMLTTQNHILLARHARICVHRNFMTIHQDAYAQLAEWGYDPEQWDAEHCSCSALAGKRVVSRVGKALRTMFLCVRERHY